jgi:hypothetical protein
MTKFMTLAALAIGFGCTDKDGDSVGEGDADTDTDTDTDTDADVPTEVNITWSTGSVEVDVTGGSGSYDFGIYETGKDAWQAESCKGDTTASFGPFCHTVAGDASTTIPCVSEPADVDDSNTLFCITVENNGNDDFLTYYIGATDDSWCAVSGPDSSDYASLACEQW